MIAFTSFSVFSPISRIWAITFVLMLLGSALSAQCSQPSNLNAVNDSPTSVTLNWSAISGATSYTVQYRLNGTTTWNIVASIPGTNTTLTGLAESTVYQWRVKASCSTYSSVASFNTGGSGNNTACSQPSNLNAVNLSPTSVTLSWSAISGAFSYTVQYRVNGTTIWTTAAPVTGTEISLTGLAESTVYQWRVKASCSSYSSVANFNTGGSGNNTSCSQPSNLNALNLSPTSVTLSWSAISGASSYTVQYRLNGTTTWTTAAPVTGTEISLTGLAESTVYQWRVKASCSTYSSIASFNTGGSGNNTSCSQPSNLNAVNVSATSVILSWSAISGASSYTVQYRLNGTTTWTTAAPVTGTEISLTGLTESTVYQWRVKASCSSYSSIASFNTGGSGNNTACSQPSNLNAVNLSTTSVTLSWSEISGAFSYAVQYRINGTTTWTIVNPIAATNVTLTGLLENTVYQWRVKASCSTYSSITTFNTGSSNGGGGSSCSAPSNTNTVSVSTTSAIVEWEPVGEASNYTVEVRQLPSGTYLLVGTVTQPGITINDLQPGLEYVWRVKASCSPFGSDVLFSTPTAYMVYTDGENQSIAGYSPADMKLDFTAYPNPVREGQLTISTPVEDALVEILDAGGRVLIREYINGTQQIIDVQQLANGLYFVKLTTSGGQSPMKKLLISY